ncbi:MAG: ABC transporter permease [Nanoarchaeota archaeon]|nr:ABC transporter permease [Nanoarchaeota archaeon]
MKLDYLGLVFEDIRQRKFSSFLTFFAISLGILTIFVIFLLGQGFEDSIAAQFEQLGSNRLYISSSTTNLASGTFTKGLSETELKLIKNKPYVKEAYPYYSKFGQIKYGKEFKSSLLFGSTINENFFKEYNLDIDQGRFPKETEKYSIVIGPTAAKELFEKEIEIGSSLHVKEYKFKVVGILKSVGNPQDDSNIYFPIDTLRNIYGDKDNIGFIDVTINENYDILIAEKNLKILLENKLGKDSIEILAPTQLLEQVGSILDIVKYTLGGIAFVALIVGAVGIINTMYVIITEKTRDIGIMKSIGAKNEDILFMYIFQAGLFGLLGAILGVVIGSFTAKGFEIAAQAAGYTFLEITIYPINIISLLLFGFFIGVLAGFLPAWKASKINIIEAIRK